MRNLNKHPLTLKEVVNGLREMAAEIAKEEAIGDIRPLILNTAANVVLRAGFAVHEVKP